MNKNLIVWIGLTMMIATSVYTRAFAIGFYEHLIGLVLFGCGFLLLVYSLNKIIKTKKNIDDTTESGIE